MTTEFEDALDELYADAGKGVDITYTPAGEGEPIETRAFFVPAVDHFESEDRRYATGPKDDAVVKLSAIPDPQPGDEFIAGDDTYRVDGVIERNLHTARLRILGPLAGS